MRITRSSLRVSGMSLIELLCVMAIIALLAAFLLPVLGGAKAQAKRIQCIYHLHQIGIGFISFTNEPNSPFPMAVPGSAGGSLELAQGGYQLPGSFYFSYRHSPMGTWSRRTTRRCSWPAARFPPSPLLLCPQYG
jgi:prepilin-type N-terminal cleavage/methylation domain-containing protein